MNSKHLAALAIICFLALRLPGIGLPFHQDEWKNVVNAENLSSAGAFFAHPPLMQTWFVLGHDLFGGDCFRFWPLLFSLLAAYLLFKVVKGRAGDDAGDKSGMRTAWWALSLCIVSFYSIWASLMADVDGSVLPFLFLSALWAYDRKKLWLVVAVCAAGFLVKLSFVLAVAAIGAEMLLRKEWKPAALCAAGFAVLSAAGLALFSWLNPHFDIQFMLSHAAGSVSQGRNWGQVVFQAMKALFYLSPLLVAPVAFARREDFVRLRPFLLYLGFGSLFYIVLFDFSQAALDKYLMFSIIPLCVLAGRGLARVFPSGKWRKSPRHVPAISILIVCAALLVSLEFVHQTVVPLYPKAEWFGRVAHLQWNVLTPFNGGSGPIGMYVSFLFIAVSFVVSIGAAAAGFFRPGWRPFAAALIIAAGLSYNAVFAEELFFGKIHGSVAAVTKEALEFIKISPDVRQVMTFNDTGAYELARMDKYAGRFYAAPQFEEGHRQKFPEFSKAGGSYLVVEFPLLYDGFYKSYFSACSSSFTAVSGAVIAKVYTCGKTRL